MGEPCGFAGASLAPVCAQPLNTPGPLTAKKKTKIPDKNWRRKAGPSLGFGESHSTELHLAELHSTELHRPIASTDLHLTAGDGGFRLRNGSNHTSRPPPHLSLPANFNQQCLAGVGDGQPLRSLTPPGPIRLPAPSSTRDDTGAPAAPPSRPRASLHTSPLPPAHTLNTSAKIGTPPM